MRTGFKTAALHVALVAMLLRAFLPAGWMPQSAAAGAPFVICTADGPVHPAKPHDADHAKSAPCVFAAAAHLAPPAEAPALAVTAAVAAVPHAAPPQAPVRPESHRAAAPRGPPISA
jgi:hypothetical protein